MAENTTPEGDRIAKVLSRRGVASRREAERLIEAGKVKVNGKTITSPALNVTDKDKITISGHPLPVLEPPRLWLYYKPEGLVTSASDEKGRDTVFDHLPEDLPRVMSVGRLDLNSEGLLLLTNDGELKRRLELPSTGWLRKYRVRINGNPTDPDLEPLRKGITVDGERFQPMHVTLDRVQGANAWLTIGLREGKNREIRRAINAIGLIVNRLIRTSYGPFRLGDLQPGQVEEVRQRVLKDQLGEGGATDPEEAPARRRGPTIARPAAQKPRLKPGEALKDLSETWQKATTRRRTPDSADTADRTPRGRAAPEGDARSAKPTGKPFGKPAAPRSAADAPRPPRKPAAPRPGSTRNAPRPPAKPGK
ncbi:pseudouridine synthase [Fuscibacter oryzae]|uniref:Pseudouridine synthase n=1 Tax=Fuscibacter oryzae TaxID=2803939 RepID=A0A8J7MNT7_9RHOB|nr:pseudouridine synthase [Fuscibacter oryzae]MBL4926722.1 rRNA pseudouridine synthase [Fuscibacter oryzae]